MRKTKAIWVPIVLGVSAIAFTISILVGWSILFTHYYALYTRTSRNNLGVGYWFLLALGCLFLAAVVTTLVLFLIENVQQILEARQQNAFIDSVTHELKSPLASLRLCLETMELRKISPEMQSRFVGMMKKDVERLGTFVEHILEAGRLEHHERMLHREWVSLPIILHQCSQRILQRHEATHPQIQLPLGWDNPTELPPDPKHRIWTDAVALETILINLLDNAIKYSLAPAQITVTAEHTPQATSIHITDQGVGLTSRQIKSIFRRFYRVHREHSPTPRGTGLGLYVVDSLIKQLGGRISVTSRGEGLGSTFSVEFPHSAQPHSPKDISP